MTDLKHTPGDGTVRIEIQAFGIYHAKVKQTIAQSGSAAGFLNDIQEITLATQTNRIPLRKGLHFGMTVIPTCKGASGSIKLRKVNRFPPPGLKNPRTGQTHLSEEIFVSLELGKPNVVSYTFDEDCEMLAGEWKIELWDGSLKLAEKSLIVEEAGVMEQAGSTAAGTSKQALPAHDSSASFGQSETVAILTESAKPTLYQNNGFRILDLPADATAREISRRKQTVEKALNHEVPVPPGPGRYFPLTPPPDQFAVRDAMQRLSDPERRLIDELFWFWPHRPGESASDEALSRLRDGKDREAEGFWLEQESDNSESSVSTHNLALLYHFRALEKELELAGPGSGSGEPDGIARMWEKSFRRWRSLSEEEGFWSRFTSRIRELEDPRLTAGTARRIRTALPVALLSICGQLVLQAAEGGRKSTATRLVEIINKSGFAEADIKAGLQTAIEPVRNRIKGLCTAAELATKNDPVHADQACRQLLASAKPLLDGLDCLLPADHPTRDLAHDDVAERALRCQVAFAKKTENWKLSVSLLESALPVAASTSVRKDLQENIEIVKKRADTNDDFCAEGYYDAPEPLLAQMEKIREMADRQNYNQAVQGLEDLLAGRTEVKVPPECVALVNEALAYCLGSRAAKSMNEAIREWNDAGSSVMKTIQRRAKEISSISWSCAGAGTIPQYVSCPCMACGTIIYSRYSVLKWTFNKDKGSVDLITCGTCADRHRSELNVVRTKLKEATRQAAQDYVDAALLDPANKFVKGQIEWIRKTCADFEVAFPSPSRKKAKKAAAKPALADRVPTFGEILTESKRANQSQMLAFMSLFLGCLTAIPAVILGHMALGEIKRSGGKLAGRNKAITGLVIAYFVIAFWFLLGISILNK